MIIEITSTPPGESPEWVRTAWIGVKVQTLDDTPVTVPTVSSVGGPRSIPGQIWHHLRGKTIMRKGYLVNARDAVGLLALQSEEAARWCIENAPQMLNPDQNFMFEETCCRPLYVH
ncbi:MAG: hypothetical protein ABJ370_23035 [Paracoccaceae bacterium]